MQTFPLRGSCRACSRAAPAGAGSVVRAESTLCRAAAAPQRAGGDRVWLGSGLAGIGSGRGSGGAVPKPALQTASGGSRGLWPRSRSEGRCCRVGRSPCSPLPPQSRSGETTCPGERAGRCVPARRWGSRSRGQAEAAPAPCRSGPSRLARGDLPEGPPVRRQRGHRGGERGCFAGPRQLCPARGEPGAVGEVGGSHGAVPGWLWAGAAARPARGHARLGLWDRGSPSTGWCHGQRRARRVPGPVPGPSPPYASRPPGVAVVPQSRDGGCADCRARLQWDRGGPRGSCRSRSPRGSGGLWKPDPLLRGWVHTQGT